jgi:DNA polymerase phi
MRCLMNQLSSPERYLHLAAEKSVKAILRRVQSETPLALPSLKGLMSSPNGEINFDLVTKTKTVEKLVTLVTDPCLSGLLQFLRRLAINPGAQDEKGLISRRRIIGDLLLIAVRSKSIDTSGGRPTLSEQGILQILSLLVELAYFACKDRLADDPPIAPASHDMFKVRISSCLTELTSKSTNPSKFAYHVVSVINSRQKLPTLSTPLLMMDDAVAEVIDKSWRILAKICSKEQSSSAEKRPVLTAFKLLYSLMILQVYNGDAEAVAMLDELRDSYHKLLGDKKSRIQGGPETLVEIILGLVAKPALLFRRIGPHVFSAITPDINESALQSMVQVCKIPTMSY